MKRKRRWILCLSLLFIGNLSGCTMKNADSVPSTMETQQQSNHIWAKEEITVIQNQSIPCADIVSEITTESGYDIQVITFTYQGETSTIKTNEKFMDLKNGILTVTSIPEANTLKNEKQVPNVAFTFKETTNEPQPLTISVTFETKTQKIETQTVTVWITVTVKSDIIARCNKEGLNSL